MAEFDLQTYLRDMENRLTTHATTRFDQLDEKVEGVEVRVRKLENWRNYLAGAWMVVSGGFVYLIKGKT